MAAIVAWDAVPLPRTRAGRNIDAVANERVSRVTDPLGRQKRRLNLTAIHHADDVSAVERRRDEAVEHMRDLRAELLREVADLTPSGAFAGEEWGAMHVLWHLAGDHTHIEPARQIVEHGATELADRDERAEYEDALERVLRNVDDWIDYSLRLTQDQLTTHARRANREYYVVGMVESTAEHLADHVDHIKQIKARVGGATTT